MPRTGVSIAPAGPIGPRMAACVAHAAIRISARVFAGVFAPVLPPFAFLPSTLPGDVQDRLRSASKPSNAETSTAPCTISALKRSI